MKEDGMQGEKTVGWVAVLYSSFIRNHSIPIIYRVNKFFVGEFLFALLFCLKNWNTLKKGG